MRSSIKLSQGLSLIALATSLALTGCGPDYAIFKVHVTAESPRDDIKECKMSIQNQKGEDVVSGLTLEKEYGTDSAGGLVLKQGCGDGLTKADVGLFSYSTSRTTGTLKFTVIAWGGPDNATIIQQGEGSADVKAYPPEITVNVPMKIVKP